MPFFSRWVRICVWWYECVEVYGSFSQSYKCRCNERCSERPRGPLTRVTGPCQPRPRALTCLPLSALQQGKVNILQPSYCSPFFIQHSEIGTIYLILYPVPSRGGSRTCDKGDAVTRYVIRRGLKCGRQTAYRDRLMNVKRHASQQRTQIQPSPLNHLFFHSPELSKANSRP